MKSSSHLFIAKKLNFSEPHQDATEQIQMIKVPFSEAVRMVMQGEITNGASCLLILKAKEYFEKNKSISQSQSSHQTSHFLS